MNSGIRPLAFLVLALTLAASPLGAQTSTRQRLDLGDLARRDDRFGSSVAVSGDGRTLVIGAAGTDARGTLSGAAHVFRLQPGGWERDPLFPQTASDTTAFDAYGLAVAVSGDGSVVAIGAPLHDKPEGNAGAVYVWERTGAGWTLRGRVTAKSDARRNDQLGTSVALSADGTVLVVGAPQPNASEDPPGKAYVFEWPSGVRSWRTSRLTVASGRPFDFFGFSVAIDEAAGVVAVGAPGFDFNAGGGEGPFDQAGAVYMFARGGGWSDRSRESTRLLAHQPAPGDEFGMSIAVSGDGRTIVVGAREGGTRLGRSGSAYVFEQSEGGWTGDSLPRVQLIASDGRSRDQFGTSVAISEDGDLVLVGAPEADTHEGQVYLFRRPGQSWAREEMKEDVIVGSCTGGLESSDFGQAVAIRGGVSAVGAPQDRIADVVWAGSVCVAPVAELTEPIGLMLDLERVSAGAAPGCAAELQAGVVPGCPVRYRITIRNETETPLSDVRLRVVFDLDRLTGVSLNCQDCAATIGPCRTAAPDTVCATLDQLAPRSSVHFALTATVRADATGRLRTFADVQGEGTEVLADSDEVVDLVVERGQRPPAAWTKWSSNVRRCPPQSRMAEQARRR